MAIIPIGVAAIYDMYHDYSDVEVLFSSFSLAKVFVLVAISPRESDLQVWNLKRSYLYLLGNIFLQIKKIPFLIIEYFNH